MSRGTNPSSHGVYGRVIIHADLDCFYCQVEHVRLGVPQSTPLAVQQWDGLIAVNYEARKFGVKRGDRTAAAKQKCPQIMLVHVETIGTERDPAGGGGDVRAVSTVSTAGTRHDKGTCKVSLERYREASFAIMAIFQAHCRRVERASIDEAYMDLTEEAARLCLETEAGKGEDVADAPETDLQGTAGHRIDPTNAFDRALLAGARLTAAMRLAVEQELGFTVSAGIASNKVLAKLASSRNKPNKQTVVPAGASSEMLDTVPLRNMRGLGGKLGEAVVSWSKAKTVSDLKRFSLADIVGKFGPKTGEWMWRVCRGIDDEPVVPNLKPKSISVCKSFTPLRDLEAVLTWMTLLSKELAHRIRVDTEAWGRRATKLTLQIISLKPSGGRADQVGAPGGISWKSTTSARSRTVDIPGGGEPPTAESLVSEAMGIFSKTGQALPCSRLALTVHDFNALVTGRGSIASFLRASPPPAAKVASQLETSDVAKVKFPGKGAVGGLSPEIDGGLLRGGSVKPRNRHTGQVKAGPHGGDGNDSRTGSSGYTGPVHHHDEGGHLIATSSESESDSEVLRKKCPKCGVTVAAESLPEHLDFHYAEGLQASYTREEDIDRDKAARALDGGVVKRGKPEGDKGGAKRRRETKQSGRTGQNHVAARIDSFFKPA